MQGIALNTNSRFEITDLPPNELKLIKCKPIEDHRGYLERLFCTKELKTIIGGRNIVQVNHTRTAKAGTIRGMHYQLPPYAEMKLISCLRGKIFDVAVDLRKNSPTFLHWHAEILSENNHHVFVVPEGFAHGFQTLTPDCEMLYFHTADHNAKAEGALNALDSRLAINWPEPITERSERDMHHPILTEDFQGINVL